MEEEEQEEGCATSIKKSEVFLLVHALSFIPRGRELTVRYCLPCLPNRRQRIKECWGFLCCCGKCEDGANDNAGTSTL